jgi:hypothetical protein
LGPLCVIEVTRPLLFGEPPGHDLQRSSALVGLGPFSEVLLLIPK